MSDKEHDIPVKVVDRRWWANTDAAGTAREGARRRSSRPTSRSSSSRSPRRISRSRNTSRSTARPPRVRRNAAAAATEISKDVERTRREILSELLEVVDNLDRAHRVGAPGAVVRRAAPGRRDGAPPVPRASSRGSASSGSKSTGERVRSRCSTKRSAPSPPHRPNRTAWSSASCVTATDRRRRAAAGGGRGGEEPRLRLRHGIRSQSQHGSCSSPA